MTKGSERQYIVKILEEIDRKGLYPSQVLDDFFYVYDFNKQQRSFITKVVYGTVEYNRLIEFVINRVSKVKLKKMKPVVRYVMIMSTYQLLFMDKVPAYSVINEGVKIVKKRKLHQLSGFVNGVLRNIERKNKEILEEVEKLPGMERLSILYGIDKQLLEYLMTQYTQDELETFLKESQKERETCIRVDHKERIQQIKNELDDGVEIHVGHILKNSAYISGYDQIDSIRPFQKGYFQIQDESSSMVGFVAAPEKGDRILDMCAAPGGKTTHLAALTGPTGKVTACDVSEHKLSKIQENINRLGLENVETELMDGTIYRKELDEAFDIVLVDVPCSGLGILRGKPDIKDNLSVEKIDQLIQLQKKILNNAKNYVKHGGALVYSTCTINKNENIEQIKWFLEENGDYIIEPIDIKGHIAEQLINPDQIGPYIEDGCLQLMTNSQLSDGFFICRLIRT